MQHQVIIRAALLCLAAGSVISCNFERKARSETVVEEAPIYVHAENPVTRPMEEAIEVYGNLEPVEQVDVVTEVSGTIIEILVEEGDAVEAGKLLARIDDEEYKLNLRQAQSAWRVARSDYRSAKQLYKEGMKSRSEYEKMKRSYEDARSNLALSKIRIKNTEVKSPIRGVVVSRNAEVYHQAGAMEALFTVADLSGFKIPITVTEAEVAKIELNQNVRVRVDALTPDPRAFPIEGSVSRIQPRVDPQTGTVQVEVSVPDPGPRARPGMFARLRIVTAVHESAMVIPRRAMTAEEGDNVWVVAGENAKLVPIKTGLTDDDGIEILSGLSLSDLVIVEGQAAITPKSKIIMVNEAPEDKTGDDSEPHSK
jgi:membrane fusion protein (multidrug efflux system)